MPKRVIAIFAVCIVLLTVASLYFFGDDKQLIAQNNTPAYVSDDWSESYSIKDTTPTGLFLFNEILEFKTKKTSTKIENELDSASISDPNTSYVFIGNKFQLKTEEFDSILDRVKKGSDLILSFKGLSENMYSFFFGETELYYDYNEYIDLQVMKKNMRMYSIHESDTVANQWNLFPKCDDITDEYGNLIEVESMSSCKNLSNFLDYSYGKGHIYLHSNPELFQNYQLLGKNGFDYAQYVAKIIPVKHQVKWLELGRIADVDEELNLEDMLADMQEGKEDNSLLQFIFQNKALTYALLLTLFGLILFLIFRTKRSQPYIPYLPKSANHSLAFAETIKEIYYKQQTPYSILQVMCKNFYVAVNKQFFIDISKTEKETEIKLLADKTGIPNKTIRELIDLFETKYYMDVNFAYLQKVSQLQQQFYHDSGIIKNRLKRKLDAKTKRYKRQMLIPVSMIILGITGILYGFYLLNASRGMGILFWPVGGILLGFGIRLYVLPLLKISAEKITFYPFFNRKRTFDLSKIERVELIDNSCVFTLEVNETQNMKFRINQAAISYYDKNAFEQLITPYLIK